MDIYKLGIKPLLFSGLKADPEWVHQQTLKRLNWLDTHPQNLLAISFLHYLEASCSFSDRRLKQNLWGLQFSNPFGLAAGFDKDGVAAGIWHTLGLGFAELGTVTFHPQTGNPQPRLFRLSKDEAVLNRMGFNNQGSEVLQQNLQQQTRKFCIPIGINLGKSKITPLEDAAKDYLGSFQRLQNLGDYFVINVSSPNTPGLRSLQNREQLATILDAIQQENRGTKPILVKIAPDLTQEAIADILDLAKTYQLAGIIATNTTIDKENLNTKIIKATGNPVTEEAGGISGKPLRDRATETIRFIWQQTEGKLPIIGVGGIFTPEDAWEKITAGASLLQVYTGLVYEGPWMVKRILEGLVQKLEERELETIDDAIGLGNSQ
ncbi:MAG: quinone-dependent dihydroorotate dehydrogenase [Cyanobacteria bacterium SBLK]|nr:quinone-dependent dihydroorotate dehydrogenase [Cyanobacteria bacterium SBLK]